MSAVLLVVGASGCELDETCDPALDPNCVFGGPIGGGSGEGTGSGTGEGTGSGTGEGTGSVDACAEGCGAGTCVDGECAYTHVLISATSSRLNAPHPGSDIDAIELRSEGRSFYATVPTDSFIPTDVTNDASDPSQAAGPPSLPGQPFACDVDAATEHWTSLANGLLVVEFGRPIRSGDEIVVWECPGVVDTYDVSLGRWSRADAADAGFTVVLEDASGVGQVVVGEIR